MSRLQLLVVDDEPDMRQMLQFHLGEEGYQVDTVGDGAAALAALAGGRYALVLLDIHLPRMSGTEVLAEVRRRWPGQKVCTLSTSVGGPQLPPGALADGHLQKPFELAELSAAVHALIGPGSEPLPAPAAGAEPSP